MSEVIQPVHPVLTTHEITDLEDDLFPPWLDLFETAFPPSEKVLISTFINILKNKKRGLAEEHQLLVFQSAPQAIAGMAHLNLQLTHSVLWLWCLAVYPQYRSQGYGQWMYQEIIQRAIRFNYRAVILEVEIPEEMDTPDKRSLAERRIQFYRRQGACILGGIRYMQSVGWHQQPIPLHVMVHPLKTLTAVEAFQLAESIFASAITQNGELTLL